MDFERRKEQSKEDIRRAAEELFSRFGAIKSVSRYCPFKAGVSQQRFITTSGSKDELVHDYRKSIVNGIAGRFREIFNLKKIFY